MSECKKINCPTCNLEVDDTFIEQRCPRCQSIIESRFICGSCHSCSESMLGENKKGLINKLFSIFTSPKQS